MSKLLTGKNSSSYFSIISLVLSALGIIILGTMRYAQVSFQIEQLHKENAIMSERVGDLRDEIEKTENKIDRLYNVYLSIDEKEINKRNSQYINNRRRNG